MKRNFTQSRKFETGRPKSPLLKTNRKKFSSNLSNNYELMLQLYYLNKKQVATQKELKYEKLTSEVPEKTPSLSSTSRFVSVINFFTEIFSSLKKAGTGITLVSE